MKNIVLTGSASGLGAYLAAEANRRGYRVIGIDKKYAENVSTVDENISIKIPCDLSDISDLQLATQRIISSNLDSGIDLLINCACQFLMQPFGGVYNDKDLVNATVTNFVAPLLLVNNLRAELEKADDPVVINISSNSAKGGPFCAHYCMSKGALNSLAYAINEEFRINGKIRAINFMLGTLETGFAIREDYLAITPVIGKDPVMSPAEVANIIFNNYESSRYVNFVDIEITPKKKFIRR